MSLSALPCDGRVLTLQCLTKSKLALSLLIILLFLMMLYYYVINLTKDYRLQLLLFQDITGHAIEELWAQCPATMVRNKKLNILNRHKGNAGEYYKAQAQMSPSRSQRETQECMQWEFIPNIPISVTFWKRKNVSYHLLWKLLTKPLAMNMLKETDSLTINIPHCLSRKVTLDLVRVKRGDTLRSIPFQELKKSDGFYLEDDTYSVDKNFVRIKTKKLSEFVCTSCDITCQAALQVVLLGTLDISRRNNFSIAKVKAFLCSSLFKIAEYRNVSVSYLIQLFVKLKSSQFRDNAKIFFNIHVNLCNKKLFIYPSFC